MLQHPGGSFVGTRSFGTAGLVNSTIRLPSHAVSFLKLPRTNLEMPALTLLHLKKYLFGVSAAVLRLL